MHCQRWKLTELTSSAPNVYELKDVHDKSVNYTITTFGLDDL